MSGYPLVSPAWLNAHLKDANLRLIDIRGRVLPATEPPPHYFTHREEYDASHIPGAVFVDWQTDITDPDSPTGKALAGPEAFAALMSRLGISNDSFVVAYDDANGMFAARVWWALQYYGHRDVAVLDGGWPRWVQAGYPTTDTVPEVRPAAFTPYPDSALRATTDTVREALKDSDVRLVDARSPAEYKGDASRAKRSGHIPGALNVPRKSLLSTDGSLMEPDALLERFAAAGLDADGDERIITYCNAGVSSSFMLLALQVAGYQNVAVYDGSWKEWGGDDSLPIEPDSAQSKGD